MEAELQRLVEAMRTGNQQIVAYRQRAFAGAAQATASRGLPDPEFTASWFAAEPETRVGPQQFALQLTQKVPWFGKRETAGRRAEHMASSLEWRAESLDRDLVARLKRTYYQVAYHRRALRINDDERALLARFERTALTRYATGEGIQQDAIRVQAELTRLLDERAYIEQQMASMEFDLVRLTGLQRHELDLTASMKYPAQLRVDLDVLLDEIDVAHPEVKTASQLVAADQAWVETEALARRPDFRFGVGYTDVGRRNDAAGRLTPPEGNGDDIVSLMVGLSIPLWGKRNTARVTAARESLAAHNSLLGDVRDDLERRLHEALMRAGSLAERVDFHVEVLLPQAEESLASAEAAYTTNRMSFVDLLSAERLLFRSRLAVTRLTADFWIALADVELALGRTFPQATEIAAAPEPASEAP